MLLAAADLAGSSMKPAAKQGQNVLQDVAEVEMADLGGLLRVGCQPAAGASLQV